MRGDIRNEEIAVPGGGYYREFGDGIRHFGLSRILILFDYIISYFIHLRCQSPSPGVVTTVNLRVIFAIMACSV